MKSSSSSSPLPGRLNIAASAKKLDVDHRISLRYYYRMADSILRQADIFRSEDNAIDLYVMLLRYSSLVSETIPYHRDYRASSQSKKVILKKKLLGTLTELEKLKPEEHQRLDDIKRKESIQIHRNNVLEWPITKKQSVANYDRQLAETIFYLAGSKDGCTRVNISKFQDPTISSWEASGGAVP